MTLKDIEQKLKAKFGDKLISNHPLNRLNTFGTGGPARLFFEANSIDEMVSMLVSSREIDIPTFLLGGGSNILVSDDGFDGLVIKNSIKGIELEGNKINCGAGEDLQSLVDFATENSLTGLEFATGIYGTVGGAIYGNAGAYGTETGGVLQSAQLVDRQGDIRIEENAYFKFGYRDSILKKTRETVVTAKFALELGNEDIIRSKCEKIKAERDNKLPHNANTAGCFFKNIPDEDAKYGKISAGKLLDEVGAKNMNFKGAGVFAKHANILLNDGSASSNDIKRLSAKLKAMVKDKFDIELTEEITLLGNFMEETI
ncbi:MAG: UDP-N-acetylmuramate dehydrogenase [candidate division Zixibacteria bacterium]|nr:UDP-N-acetylmuramate dehydrogenase [candidate division Zixibacteria bacterium]